MTVERRQVAGILLAAGSGSRLGLPKALVRWDGQLLVERGVDLLAAGGCAPVIVVIGADADTVRAAADLRAAKVVEVADPSLGIGKSLACGLDVAEEAGASAAVIALVDQPLIGHDAVALVRESLAGGAELAVATYQGKQRHPVGFAAPMWDDVRASAAGDQGARSLLRSARGVVRVPCDGTGRPDDVDTASDLYGLAASMGVTASADAVAAGTCRRDPHDGGV